MKIERGGGAPGTDKTATRLGAELRIFKQIAEEGKLGGKDIPPEQKPYYIGVGFYKLQVTLEVARTANRVLPEELLQEVYHVEEQYGSQAREWRDSLRKPK